jgi:hypothetical protein
MWSVGNCVAGLARPMMAMAAAVARCSRPRGGRAKTRMAPQRVLLGNVTGLFTPSHTKMLGLMGRLYDKVVCRLARAAHKPVRNLFAGSARTPATARGARARTIGYIIFLIYMLTVDWMDDAMNLATLTLMDFVMAVLMEFVLVRYLAMDSYAALHTGATLRSGLRRGPESPSGQTMGDTSEGNHDYDMTKAWMKLRRYMNVMMIGVVSRTIIIIVGDWGAIEVLEVAFIPNLEERHRSAAERRPRDPRTLDRPAPPRGTAGSWSGCLPLRERPVARADRSVAVVTHIGDQSQLPQLAHDVTAT